MIVQCEQCQTRFKIPDEKVTDKGVKVRCTKCQHTFRVSRTPAGAAAPSAPGPVPSAPANGGFDPFERFGTAPEPKGAQVTRPGFFAEGVEASRTTPPQAAPPAPWNAADAGLEEDAHHEPTRVQPLPLPPEARPPVPSLPPLPFDFPPAAAPGPSVKTPAPGLAGRTPAPGQGLSVKAPTPGLSGRTPAPGQGLSGRTPLPGQGIGRPGAAPSAPQPNVPAVAPPRGPAAPAAAAPSAPKAAPRPGAKPPAPAPAQPAVPPAADLFTEFFANPGAAPVPLPELPPEQPAAPLTPVPSQGIPPGGLNASFGFGDKGSFGAVDTDLSDAPPDLGPPPEFDPAPMFSAPAPTPVAAPPPPAARPAPVAPAARPVSTPAPVARPVPTSSAPAAAPVARVAPAAPPPPAPAAPVSPFPFADEDPFGPASADLGGASLDLRPLPEPAPAPQFAAPAPAPVAAPAPAAPVPPFPFADEDPFGSVGVDLSAPSQDELSAPVPAPMLGRSGPLAAPPAAPMPPAAPAAPPRPMSSAPASFDDEPAPLPPSSGSGFGVDFAPPGPMDFGMIGDDQLSDEPAPAAPSPSPFAMAAPAAPQPDPFAPPDASQPDPFAMPDQAGASDPFAVPPDPFGAPPDPFAAPAEAHADPFAAPPDPFAAPAEAHADPFAAAAGAPPDPFAAAEHGFSPTETGRQKLGSGDASQGFLTQTDTRHQTLSPTETGRQLLDFPPRGMQEQGSGLETADAAGSRELIDLPSQPEEAPAPAAAPAPNLAGPAIARPVGRPADMGIPERRKPSAAQQVTGQVAYLTIAAGLLLALTAVGGVYMKEGRVDASALSPATLLKLVTPSEFVAHNVSNGLYDTRGGGSVFYVRGEVENRSSKPVRMKVRAALYDGSQRVKSAEGLAGGVPTPEELHAVTNEETAAQLRSRLDAASTPLAPGARAPFVVMFHEYPQELGQFRLVVSMEAAPEEGGKQP